MNIRNSVFLLFSFLFLQGCDIEDCLSTKTYNVKFGFYHLQNEEKYSVRVSQIKPTSIDSILVEGRVIGSGVLVLNPSDTTTSFDFELVVYELDTTYLNPPDNTEFDVDTASVDTLRRFIQFSYKKAQRIISPECGVEQTVRNLWVTDSDFDSVAVVDDQPDRFDEENVQIYF